MEAMAWSMIMTGCALFGMLTVWMLRGGPPTGLTISESSADDSRNIGRSTPEDV